MRQQLTSAAAYIFAKNKNGGWAILCGKRAGNNPMHQGGFYNVPVGMCEYGETGEQTAQRECMEETGLNIPIGKFKLVGTETWGIGKCGGNCVVVLDRPAETYQIGQGDGENERFMWLPVSQIDSLRWAYGMNQTATDIFNRYVGKQLNEDDTQKPKWEREVWGIPLADRWEYAAFTMSKGVAQDFITRHGEPKSIKQVRYCLNPDKSLGFLWYGEVLMSKKAKGKDVKIEITDEGWLQTYVIENGRKRILAIVKYDFNRSLIGNIRRVFDKTV